MKRYLSLLIVVISLTLGFAIWRAWWQSQWYCDPAIGVYFGRGQAQRDVVFLGVCGNDATPQ